MSEDTSAKEGVSWTLPILLLVAVLFGGRLSFLSSPAPEPETKSEEVSGAIEANSIPSGDGIVSQRSQLWIDPLKGLEKIKPELDAEKRAERFQNLLADLTPRPRIESIVEGNPVYAVDSPRRSGLLMMPVLLSGGNGEDAIKRRKNTREAVVQSLMSQGYRLQYPDRLSYMQLPFQIGLGAGRNRFHHVVVPFKLYTYRPGTEDQGARTTNGYEKVLVLYLDQSQLGNDPLCALAQLCTGVFLPLSNEENVRGVYGSIVSRPPNGTTGSPESNQRDESVAGESTSWFRRIIHYAAEDNQLVSDDQKSRVLELIKRKVGLAVIGPANSDGLFAMLRDDARWDRMNTELIQDIEKSATSTSEEDKPGRSEIDKQIEREKKYGFILRSEFFARVFNTAALFSARSTIDRSTIILQDDRTLSSEVRNNGSFQFHDCGLRIAHMIGTDHDLAIAIQRELQLRFSWPSIERGRLLLITERDTLYGTYVVKPFQKLGLPADRIHCVRYLKSNIDRSDLSDRSIQSQLDSEIDLIRQNSGTENDRSRYLAIGVFGSSTESKIEILKCVRGLFPSAVLFTTDVENSLLYRRDPDLQNVLVAGHYGLSLNPRLKLQVPGFRTGYQTSAFLSCLAALRSRVIDDAFPVRAKDIDHSIRSKLDPWGRSEEMEPVLHPVVFEIGRFQPYQFAPTKNQFAAVSGPLAASVQTVAAERLSDRWDALLWFLMLLFACVLLATLIAQLDHNVSEKVVQAWKTIRRWGKATRYVAAISPPKDPTDEKTKVTAVEISFLIVFAFLILLFALMIVSDQSASGEPIGIGNGISIWPSIWMLAACGAIAGVLIPWSQIRIAEERKQFEAAIEWNKHARTQLEAIREDQSDEEFEMESEQDTKLDQTISGYRDHLGKSNFGKVFFTSILLSGLAIVSAWILDVDLSPPSRGLAATLTAWGVQLLVALATITFVCQATLNVSRARETTTKWLKYIDRGLRKTCQEIDAEDQQTNSGGLRKRSDLWQRAAIQSRSAWETIELVGNHSQIVSRPVEAAAIIVLIFGVSRTRLFDAWAANTATLVLLLIVLSICIVFSAYLRSDLRKRRRDILSTIRKMSLSAELSGQAADEKHADDLKTYEKAISSVSKGAFQSNITNPVLRAAVYAVAGFSTALSQWISVSLFR
ncbi:hypothetical protein [Roseiconus lacunae]|uniref:hypothetical protein n=1 Tax=Roseiconus lacunae TaxID=2605694 RepID=UPI001E30AA5E|nr:hypothetical protein [Roseiconus lacunae]MCD0458012.1 hypothetical protein [Roseiconus lacunae]